MSEQVNTESTSGMNQSLSRDDIVLNTFSGSDPSDFFCAIESKVTLADRHQTLTFPQEFSDVQTCGHLHPYDEHMAVMRKQNLTISSENRLMQVLSDEDIIPKVVIAHSAPVSCLKEMEIRD
jgi:hypothetical protein